MTSPHTHLESRNNPIQPILEFDLDDHLRHVSPIITSHHGLRYDPMQPIANKVKAKVTRTIPHTSSLANYSSKSTSHEKDAKLERLQQQVTTLQQTFIRSYNDNKELKSHLIQLYYLEEAESSFQITTSLVRPIHLTRLKDTSHEPLKYPNQY